MMKNLTITKLFLIALTALSFVAPCSATVLAFYDIESNLTQADEAGAPGLTASAIDATGASGTSSNFAWEGSRVPYWFSDIVNNGTDPGVADILGTFSLTPDSGQQIELATSDVFNIGVLAYQNSGPYEATVRLIVASDSAFTNILATSTTLLDNDGNGGSTQTSGFLDLDNAVTSASTLYFGVAMVDNVETNSYNARFDAVQVNGTVTVIPEPSAALLGGLGALLLLRRRR